MDEPVPATCPMCGSQRCRVVEEAIDEVTVIECDDCGASWAVRHDE